MSAMMTAGTHIDCCISNYAQAEIIPDVNRSVDVQHGYHVMTHVTKTGFDQVMMAATSDKDNVSLAFAAVKF
jgi:hypothetical protein